MAMSPPRRRWLPIAGRANNSIKLEYACLGDDEDILKRTHKQRKTKRLVEPKKSQRSLLSQIARSTADSSTRKNPKLFDPIGWTGRLDEDRLDGLGNSDREGKGNAARWYELRYTSSGESDEEGRRMMYAAKHYFGKTTSTHLRKKAYGGALPRLNCGSLSLKAALKKDPAINISQSFETQETHLEESSEATSVSTAVSIEESSQQQQQRKIRWADEATDSSLVTVHSFEHGKQATCRVVILLLMNNGAKSQGNFEFLHCEFREDERLKTVDALKQITELVGCSSDRPFTALYWESREMINAFALQDYGLIDGQSILVAIREGSETRDVLIKQSAMLLADKQLRREIRKARISGRSLQILHSTEELHKLERQKAEMENQENDKPKSEKEEDKSFNETPCEEEDDDVAPSFSFGSFSNLSFHDEEFDAAGFYDDQGMNDAEQQTFASMPSWLDDDFFKGREFFLKDDTKAAAAAAAAAPDPPGFKKE